MTDDVRFSVLRRKLLAGLGAAAIGGVTASAVGRAAPARAQESKSGAVVPSILAFDVNDSLLNIRHLAPLFERLFGDGKLVKTAVTLVLFGGIINEVVAAPGLLAFAPVQCEKTAPPGALPAESVRMLPAPKVPLPLPLFTVSV